MLGSSIAKFVVVAGVAGVAGAMVGCERRGADEAAAAAAPVVAPKGEVAARTPTARRMPVSAPMRDCSPTGKWTLHLKWESGNKRCKGAPDQNEFRFDIRDEDGEFTAALGWDRYEPSSVEVQMVGDDCLVDLQADSEQFPGAGIVFSLTENDGKITGQGMYEVPIDLAAGKTCAREFEVEGVVQRKN
jgi:hypothetical protein